VRQRRYRLLRGALLVLAALLLQVGVVADLRLFDAAGDLLLVLVIAIALVEGPDRGATWGFVAGIAYDLLLDTPFGLTALVYALVGFLVGAVGVAMVRPAGWWPVVIAAVAGFLATFAYAVVGNLVGIGEPLGGVPAVALVVAGWSAVLVLPVMRLARWAVGNTEPDRIAMALPGRLS